ncbi:MAG: FAD-dependent oxidoreductase [Clostridiales bacterium]|nr:FAD-dependent oxidoreductase [Clostridiales bacterium]
MSKVTKAKYTSEASVGFTHRTAMEEAARCLLCHDAPCSKGCPAGTDPARFIRSIRFRNPKGAAETIRENNVLGGTCARVCPTGDLCEEACSRCGIDKPIEIGKLQRYAVEQEKTFKMKVLKTPAKKKAGKVACVGAGPASLACAAELAKAGYRVTVFEKEEKAGGVLTYGIAPSRLPQAVVDHDVAQVKGLGVKFEFGRKVGDGIDLSQMGFDAVFIGAGLWGGNLPDIPGKGLAGAYTAVDFLKSARTKQEAFDFGKRVVVVGGGDVAVDCAVTAKLLGADEVRIVYRRTLEEAPGSMSEFQYALSLGIGITTNMAPAELVGESKLEYAMFNGRDGKSGLKIAADAIVFATGQKAEDMSKIMPVALNEKGLVKATAKGKTNMAKVFAGGDVVNGGGTVVEAVKAGKDAAASIIAYLEKKGVK